MKEFFHKGILSSRKSESDQGFRIACLNIVVGGEYCCLVIRAAASCLLLALGAWLLARTTKRETLDTEATDAEKTKVKPKAKAKAEEQRGDRRESKEKRRGEHVADKILR